MRVGGHTLALVLAGVRVGVVHGGGVGAGRGGDEERERVVYVVEGGVGRERGWKGILGKT